MHPFNVLCKYLNIKHGHAYCVLKFMENTMSKILYFINSMILFMARNLYSIIFRCPELLKLNFGGITKVLV